MEIVKPDSIFGEWLLGKIREHGMTMEEFAEDIGISRRTINRHIHARHNPQFHVLQKYAEYFGEDWERLYNMILQS